MDAARKGITYASITEGSVTAIEMASLMDLWRGISQLDLDLEATRFTSAASYNRIWCMVIFCLLIKHRIQRA